MWCEFWLCDLQVAQSKLVREVKTATSWIDENGATRVYKVSYLPAGGHSSVTVLKEMKNRMLSDCCVTNKAPRTTTVSNRRRALRRSLTAQQCKSIKQDLVLFFMAILKGFFLAASVLTPVVPTSLFNNERLFDLRVRFSVLRHIKNTTKSF